MRAPKNTLAGGTLVLGFLEAAVILDGQVHQLNFLRVARERRLFGLDPDRLGVGQTCEIANLPGENFLAALKPDDPFLGAREYQLAARRFDRKLLIRRDTLLRDLEYLFGARPLASNQIKRVSNLGEFKIRRSRADDYVVPRAIQLELLILGPFLGCVLRSPQNGIENRLGVLQFEN